jgi:hypothetical protein
LQPALAGVQLKAFGMQIPPSCWPASKGTQVVPAHVPLHSHPLLLTVSQSKKPPLHANWQPLLQPEGCMFGGELVVQLVHAEVQ